MARKKIDRKPPGTKCYQCEKIISIVIKSDLEGFNWKVTPTEEWGADRKIYTGLERKMGRGIYKEHYTVHVCKDCMTIDDIKESSFYPEVKQGKIKYVQERDK